MNDDPVLIRDANPAGEFFFRASGLFLSFHLGSWLALEQRTSDRLWSGRSVRGDLKVLVPGEERIFRHSRSAEFAHLTIAPQLLASFDVSVAQLRPHALLRDVPLRYLMEALLSECALGQPSRLFAEGAARALVARLLELNGQPDRPVRHGLPPVLLQRALSLLEDRLEQNISVLELALACDLSPAHFSVLFKRSMGEAPHRYQLRRRVERARTLLAAGTSPAQAALAVGFCDQSHLARHMRRVLGISPALSLRSSSKRTGRRRDVL